MLECRGRNDKADVFCFVLNSSSGDVFHYLQYGQTRIIKRHVEEVNMPVVKNKTALAKVRARSRLGVRTN